MLQDHTSLDPRVCDVLNEKYKFNLFYGPETVFAERHIRPAMLTLILVAGAGTSN